MKRLGVVARADNGGLGNLLWEFCRHMQPDRVLIMDLGEYGRSDVHLDRFDGLDYRVVRGLAPGRDDRAWLLDGCDVLYSAETWYADEIPYEAKERGVRTVLHVMPELHTGRIADELWTPTTWRREFLPTARLVPVPIALDRFEFRPRSPARHFVHVWAPAMMDRNGTSPTLAALELVRTPMRCTIIGAQQRLHLENPASPVTMKSEPCGYPDNYFDIWPEDADVLILPRRYAGLSMPVQEAAARGMAAIMPMIDPQSGWPGVAGFGTRGRPQRVQMAGGIVDVFDPDPSLLAGAIEAFASEDYAREMSLRARGWAEGLSWDVWAPRYRGLLGLSS